MSVEMKDVYSSHVAKIGYDAERRELIVEWDSGKKSAYSGVPPDVAQQTMNAWSIGSTLRTAIKGVYQHRYL